MKLTQGIRDKIIEAYCTKKYHAVINTLNMEFENAVTEAVKKLFSKFDLTETEGFLTIVNSENLEEKETFVTPIAKIEMKGQNSLQQIGSTHTYLKRYCYYNALEIVANDEFEPTIANEEYDDAIKAINDFSRFFEKELNDFLLLNNSKTIADLEPIEVIKFKKFMRKKLKLDSELNRKVNEFNKQRGGQK